LAVQRLLSSGSAAQALQLLGQQESQFRGGALAEERAVARVLAWCVAGQPEQARAARQRFFTSYPRSPHAQRLLNTCAK
jgi:outer membrane protein assembly factor BamD (BamD/ComL family)